MEIVMQVVLTGSVIRTVSIKFSLQRKIIFPSSIKYSA